MFIIKITFRWSKIVLNYRKHANICNVCAFTELGTLVDLPHAGIVLDTEIKSEV